MAEDNQKKKKTQKTRTPVHQPPVVSVPPHHITSHHVPKNKTGDPSDGHKTGSKYIHHTYGCTLCRTPRPTYSSTALGSTLSKHVFQWHPNQQTPVQAHDGVMSQTHTHIHTSHSLTRIGLSRPTVTPLTALLPPAVRSIDFAPDIFSSFPQLSCSQVHTGTHRYIHVHTHAIHAPKTQRGERTRKACSRTGEVRSRQTERQSEPGESSEGQHIV